MLHDYTAVTADSVTEITETAIVQADAAVDAVVLNEAPRTYANTLAPLDRAGVAISDAAGSGSFMARVHTNADVRAAAVAAGERTAKWGSDLIMRSDLAAAIRSYATTEDARDLNDLETRNLEFWLRDLRRAGHDLDDGDRERLRDLQQRLIELQVAFSSNLDEWDDGIEMTRDDLAGLPDSYIDRLESGDSEGTFRVSMNYPDYIPFVEEAENRDLRRQMQYKFWNRAAEENTPLLGEAVDIREEIAGLLGYDTWARYAMEVKMADPEAVDELYASIIPGLTSRGVEELATLQDLAAIDLGDEAIQSWDWMYYHTKQRKLDYGIDQSEVAEYFPLESVVAGMFEITGDVFGLDYREVEETGAWHDDAKLYEIRNRGSEEPIAFFYADLFPREGKFGHAACFSITGGLREDDGHYRAPVAAIVANFTKPGSETPSLLKHDEVVTLFHEFGHVLHFCLTEVEHPRFAGYDTEWDFVEAPSQIMEHWTWEPEVLQRFARHYETGEEIPFNLVERLVAARDQNTALTTLRQAFLGKFDLAIHTGHGDVDIERATREAFTLTLIPYHDDTHFAASFGHLMGGYDAGYYGYQWAKVYGDDMFSVFSNEGVLNPDVGARYRREVLARGYSRDAIEHLRAFLGREPSSDAYLKNLGLKG
ncbi:MAG: M3 family metallopeptidase [Actinomycetota bacterium]|nr:M3 family metallopeptidase [Actinomycetota bacterium]